MNKTQLSVTQVLFCLLLVFRVLLDDANAQTNDSLKQKHTKSDTIEHLPHFEISFGQSLLFISDGQLNSIRNQASVIVPTNAFLFFIEFRPEKTVKIPVFLNLPTESKQYLINGQLINKRASPTFGAGLEFNVFKKTIDTRSSLNFEIGPLASFIFNTKNDIRVVPIIAGRFRLKRGENFVMYAGCSYSFGINALGLLYGTGTIF